MGKTLLTLLVIRTPLVLLGLGNC